IGRSCDDSVSELISDFTVENVAEIVTIDATTASEYEDVVIRLSTEQYINDDEEIRIKESISVIAIKDISNPEEPDNDFRIACTEDRLQRLVISRPSGNADKVADILGLDISETCSCSNDALITVDVPYGIDLETLRPRSKERVSQALTDSVGIDFDLIIRMPKRDLIFDENDGEIFSQQSENADCFKFNESNTTPSVADEPSQLTVAFIDSGFDLLNLKAFVKDHKFDKKEPECLDGSGLTFSSYGLDLLQLGPSPQDEIGHGTHVASAFISNMKARSSISVLHFKFIGNSGGSYFDALCASYIASASGAKILNWSWGFEEEEIPASLDHLLLHLDSNQVVAIAAAGNDSIVLADDITFYPSVLDSISIYPAAASPKYNSLISVGSYHYPSPIGSPLKPARAAFSNYNKEIVDVAAYGTVQTPDFHGGGMHYPAGTSISAPLVSRRLAELWSARPDMDHLTAIQQLRKSFVNFPPNMMGEFINGQYLPVGCGEESAAPQ
ncbi:MAG: S8 family serine peptidase, partial [Bacteroidota bacterium]